ncbi:MAG: U32 family peptidase [Thermodesulfobacteriota bacterium]
MKIPELLAPAGNLQKLRIAVRYGADAVYLGGRGYSLRAHAALAPDDLGEAIAAAHAGGVRAYVTVNIFAHNRDLDDLPAYLLRLAEHGADAIIVADPGVLAVARRTVPALPVHLSTQANVTNRESAAFWVSQGVRRINLARELSLAEIAAIRAKVDCGLEVFVHGALCISYSGRCLLSHYLTGRSANRGDCAHPCRYRYAVGEELRPGHWFPVEEDERGAYIFNSRDLCLIGRLPELAAAGVDSVKIEGRMKSPYYVGATVRAYRAALDWMGETAAKGGETAMPPVFAEEIGKIGSRGYTENFLDQPPATRDMLHAAPRLDPSHEPVAIVRAGGGEPLLEVRNPLAVGEEIEYLGSGLAASRHLVLGIRDRSGAPVARANPNAVVEVHLQPPAADWLPDSLVRRASSGK